MGSEQTISSSPKSYMPIVLITGCSNGGIGAALCRSFLARGYVVYASARSVEAMSDLVHENVRKLVMDVADDAQVLEETGGIDILVSNAGCVHIGALLDTPFEEGIKVMQTNFFGFVRLVKHVVPHMARRKKGKVVVIGSIYGELATPFEGFYNASKAALHSYAETLRMECQPVGVKVVLVAPGAVKSNIAIKSAYTVPEDSLYKSFEKQINHVRYISQSKDSGVMDTDEYLSLGGFTTVWWFLKWLRRTTAESLIWSMCEKEPKSSSTL
ncbi:NAD-binding protein [Roridomyces roridus]|uniref:NAD-binding protein n=1 Tax=Roridomyces roridus TaxID=1738132 RepID=A0AAD7FK61_9AGAR|nr:NAD-binding protein [Roridomyces roridus]